ncbi:multidrug efflux SMR transporter [Streptomyces sp. NP160]|uniref:DMT family transporter n=1 Tax=Streptomyces sp. NP160 TaxID=2586637 RepID=UPI00214B4720|nr:SMR family transporter [Streptomyces sp. NP160]
MAWVLLLGSGAMEAVWAIALAGAGKTRRIAPAAIFVGATALSLGGLALAMREIPTGTAYAVWAGTGAALTVL